MIVKWLETPIGQKNDRKQPVEFHEIYLAWKIKRYYLAFILTRWFSDRRKGIRNQ